jgi:hypothetical protein
MPIKDVPSFWPKPAHPGVVLVQYPFGDIVSWRTSGPGEGEGRERAGAVLDQRAGRLHGAEKWTKGGVHIVHTFAFGPGRTGTGLAWIGDVFGISQRLQGLECSSSPTSGTASPLVRGVFALMCGH